jgi:hypothetical protein
MRVSVSNWQTSREDITRTVARVERALTSMRRRKAAEKRPIG